LQDHPAKINRKVLNLPLNLYASWRAGVDAQPALRDAQKLPPPEQLLQAVWFHQRLCRDRLVAADGQPVRVLHPGFWNHESGPDFRSAVIQLGSSPPRTGDVEIDLAPAGWRGHGHATNPAYANVILHVVWEGGAGGVNLPTLALKPVLDAPVDELALWLGSEAARHLPGELAGHCAAPLKDLSDDVRSAILQQAALVRLRRKAAQFEARARQAGWDQALWEGLFRALGYKHNVWPMQRLGELRPSLQPDGAVEPLLTWQARLLGVAGLLPAELTRGESDAYLRRIWDAWWRERATFAEITLPKGLWRFNGMRPANHPQRRLALASHWLARGDLIPRLENWFTAEIPATEWVETLLNVLQAEPDEFWSWHWTFRSARMPQAQPLLGATRVTDLAINIILPWFWIRAAAGKNTALQEGAERRYLKWPAAEDNVVLRLARQRLLGGASAKTFPTAASQQGLLQIVRDFCDHSNAVCAECKFPELVKALR
jgi:hypothetical protein